MAAPKRPGVEVRIGPRLLGFFLAVAAVCPQLAGTELEREFHVRAAWGGASRSDWRGVLSVTRGRIVDFAPLGVEADLPGTFYLTPRGLAFESLRPTFFQAVDLTIRAPADTHLQLTMQAGGSENSMRSESVPLSNLWKSPLNVEWDRWGNRLLLQPTPGDELWIRTPRDHMVFSPGESWQIDVFPREDLLRQDSAKFTASIRGSPSGETLWRTQQTLQGKEGAPLPAPVRLTLNVPSREGVYELGLRMSTGAPTHALASKSNAVERKVQFLVLDGRGPRRNSDRDDKLLNIDNWTTILELDPSQPRWWERILPLPSWNRLGAPLSELIYGGTAVRTQLDKRQFSRLDTGGWQAIPLSVSSRNSPHVVEIEYPTSRDVSLSLAIVEANESGEILPRIATAGIAADGQSDGGETQRYRFLYWPRTERPVLLLQNLHHESPALYATIRVRAGPPVLPASFTRSATSPARELWASFEEPVILDMFSAVDAVDPMSKRPLTDWNSFLTSSLRLAEYLRFAGYTGVSINILSDGSAIVPFAHWEAVSRHDTGPYFSSGQDPVRKDVLELLLRIFDREGLRLSAGLRFSGRLPALERLLRESAEPAGIHLIRADGKTWRELYGSQGRGHFYNPLDERVQRAMLEVVRDVVRRYGHHPSFAGVRIDLGPETYATLPDPTWGLDPTTLARFLEEQPVKGVSSSDVSPATILASEGLRDSWVQWRAQRLTNLFRAMLAEVQTVRPEGRLWLSGARLIEAPAIRRAAMPSLPRTETVKQAMLGMGLDWKSLSAIPGLIPIRSWPSARTESLVAQGPLIEFQRDSELDETLGSGHEPAVGIYQQPRVLTLPRKKTEGGTGPAVGLVVAADSVGARGRSLFERSLTTLDAHYLFVGGWRPSLGNLELIREFANAYRDIPASRAAREISDPGGSVVARQYSDPAGDTLVICNRSRNPAEVQMTIEVDPGTSMLSPAGIRAGSPDSSQSGRLTWPLTLPGHGTSAVRLTGRGTLDRLEATFPPSVFGDLRNQLADLFGRTAQMRNIEPPPYLSNPGFEPPQDGTLIPGWEYTPSAGCSIELDFTRFKSGSSSLRMCSSGPSCWIRSEPISPPKTGRLTLHLQVRREQLSDAPLRIAVEGRHAGRPYYRGAQVDGSLVNTPQTRWSPFVLQISDLPDSQLEDLRIRFDLLGAGEVWIDDLGVYDLDFSANELNELSKLLASADVQLNQGELAKCEQTLARYWPRFVQTFVPPAPRVADQRAAAEGDRPPSPPDTVPGFLDRVRHAIPVLPSPLPKR